MDSSLVVILSGNSEQIVRSRTAAVAKITIGNKPVHATDGVWIDWEANKVICFIRGPLSGFHLRGGQSRALHRDLRGGYHRACCGYAIREFASVDR